MTPQGPVLSPKVHSLSPKLCFHTDQKIHSRDPSVLLFLPSTTGLWVTAGTSTYLFSVSFVPSPFCQPHPPNHHLRKPGGGPHLTPLHFQPSLASPRATSHSQLSRPSPKRCQLGLQPMATDNPDESGNPDKSGAPCALDGLVM